MDGDNGGTISRNLMGNMPRARVALLPAQPSDCGRLTEVARSAKARWGYPTDWLDEWREVLTITPECLETTIAFKAVVEREIVGFYALSSEPDRVELEHMWVVPAAMGRGVGRLLFQHAVGAARQLGAERMLIESDPNAADFYRHMGCTSIGERHGTVAGMPRVLPLLELVLSPAVSADR